MTSHAELSKQLALALGYYPESVRVKHEGTSSAYCQVYRICRITFHESPYWQAIDYRSPDVAMPLLKWLGIEYRKFFWFCAPTSSLAPRWACSGNGIIADTLEEAIARAVIAIGGK